MVTKAESEAEMGLSKISPLFAYIATLSCESLVAEKKQLA